MSAETLITSTAQFLVLFFAVLIVTIPSVITLLGNSRREIYDIRLNPDNPGTDYLRSAGYIANRTKQDNKLRALVRGKLVEFTWLTIFAVAMGIIFPTVTEIVSVCDVLGICLPIKGWETVTDPRYIFLLILCFIIAWGFIWVINTVRKISEFENIEDVPVDEHSEKIWKASIGLMNGTSISHDNPDWVWKPSRQGLIIEKDKHKRRIDVPGISRSISLEQHIENQGVVPGRDGPLDLGWRLLSMCMGDNGTDKRTTHIGLRGQRGRIHRDGDYFKTLEELLPVADEWMEWAIKEWQDLDAKYAPW